MIFFSRFFMYLKKKQSNMNCILFILFALLAGYLIHIIITRYNEYNDHACTKSVWDDVEKELNDE